MGIGHVAVQHRHRAGLNPPDAGNQRQHAGLAHPVGTDEAHHAAGGKIQVDRVHRQSRAIAMSDAGQPRDRAGRAGHGDRFTWSDAGQGAFESSRT